jgi:heparanase 1
MARILSSEVAVGVRCYRRRIVASSVVAHLLALALAAFSYTGSSSVVATCTVPVTVSIDTVLFRTSPRFMSVAIDQGAFVKPPQWELWRHQMTSPTVTAICQMLRPAFVRIGGTASATITYDMSTGAAAATSSPSLQQRPAAHGGYSPQQPYRLPAAHWSAVCSWAAKVGWPIVFGLNLLSNRTGGANGTEHWVADNAVSLIGYTTKHHPGAVAGWELGNEPEGWKRNFGFSLSNSEIAADFARLRSLLRSEFSASQYLVVGPDQGIQGCLHSGSCGHYEELVALLMQHDSIDVSSFHFYNMGKNVNPQAEAALFTDPATFDLTKRATLLAVNATRGNSPSSPAFPVWLGETATASGGGLAGSSGTYTATLLMLDKLGSVGRWGGTGLMRQSLFAGQYALLDPATYLPRPTFFVAAIFTQLVGTHVLAVDGDGASNRTLRVYARCANVDRYGVGAVVVFGGKHQYR